MDANSATYVSNSVSGISTALGTSWTYQPDAVQTVPLVNMPNGLNAPESFSGDASLSTDAPTAADYEKLKKALDKATKEAGEYRKQLQARMSTDELEKEKSNQAIQELQEKYDALVRESTIDKYTDQYRAMPGFDEKLARATAEALYNGETETVFANQQKANQAYEKQMKADALKGMKPPAGGDKGEDESENIRLAKEIGRRNAESRKASDDILSNYFVGRR